MSNKTVLFKRGLVVLLLCVHMFTPFTVYYSVADVAHGHVRGDLVLLCKQGSTENYFTYLFMSILLAQCEALSRMLQHREWEVQCIESELECAVYLCMDRCPY